MAHAAQEPLTYAPEINLAQRLVARFGLTPPVDVLTLARKYADVSIESIPVDVDGVCYDLKKSGVRPKIVLNRVRPSTRLRFTAAHELGHVLIPWHTGVIVDDTSSDGPGAIPHYRMEEEANRFASELLLPSDWVLSELRGCGSPIELIARTAAIAQVSSVATAIKLVSLLGPGHFYAQVDTDGTIIASGRSPGTVAPRLRLGRPVHAEIKFSIIERHWTGKVGGALYCWWKLPKSLAVPTIEDTREWRLILEDILRDLAQAGAMRQHAKQSINGVIGAANVRSSSHSNEILYAALLQRFEAKRNENSLYERLVRHPKFSDFLAQRVAALKN